MDLEPFNNFGSFHLRFFFFASGCKEVPYEYGKSFSKCSCSLYDDDFATFEKHTTRIGSNFMKKMEYQEKGLDINGQGIVNLIKVQEFPRYAGIFHVRKEVGECSKTTNDKLMKVDGSASQNYSDSEDSTGSSPCHEHTKRKH